MSLIRKMQNVQKRKINAKMAYNATLAECQHSVIVTARCKSDTYCGSKVNDYRYTSAGIGVARPIAVYLSHCHHVPFVCRQTGPTCSPVSALFIWPLTADYAPCRRSTWQMAVRPLNIRSSSWSRCTGTMTTRLSTLHSAVSVTVSRPNSWPTVVNWTLGLQRLID